MNTIIFNNTEMDVSEIKAPCLIHGLDGSGASQFTISLAANLAGLDNKIVFFCAFAQGRHSLFAELGGKYHDQVLIAEPGNEPAFLNTLNKHQPELDYVIVKNVEKFSVEVFKKISTNQNVILSGNFDEFNHLELLPSVKTQVLFSPTKTLKLAEELPFLEKYEGLLVSDFLTGRVKLDIS